MKVLMFKPQFAEAVEAGTKRQTVRPRRKNPIEPGDELSLRKWTGLPYRSPQILLRTAICAIVRDITITRHGFAIIDGIVMPDAEQEEFARADGFTDSDTMVKWFKETHGLPFHGTLIKWN